MVRSQIKYGDKDSQSQRAITVICMRYSMKNFSFIKVLMSGWVTTDGRSTDKIKDLAEF